MADDSNESLGLAPTSAAPTGDVGAPDDAAYASDTGDDVVAAPQGLGGRLSDSFGALVFGIIAVPLCCIGLFWNEGHAVHVARALTEAGATVQSIATNRRDPALDGHLVHVAGRTTTAGGVTDAQLGVHAPALVLARTVEMFQWSESEQGSGNDRKFVYRRDWSEQPVSSSRFHAPGGHENPSFPAFRSRTFGATDARIDAYPVGAAAVRALPASDDLPTNDAGVAALGKATNRAVHASGGAYFVGPDASTPRIGDLRVGYKSVPEGAASFLGRQTPDGLELFRTSNGQEVLLAGLGTRTSEELVAKGQDDNRVMTWVIRLIALLFLLFAFVSLFAPVNVLASYVPFLGGLVSGATFVVALAATVLVGGVVIAVAWLTYRPLLGGGLIVGAVAVAAALHFARRKTGTPRLRQPTSQGARA